MLVVHHLGVSQSEKIVWLCEELEIPYQLVRYARDPVTRLAPPEYKALHPAGTAPVIQDGDLTLAESGAIIEYLLRKYGGGRLELAADQPNFPDYLFWLHYANASLLPIVIGLMSQPAGAASAPSAQQGFGQRGPTALRMIENRLATHPYFAGETFTAADIMMVLPLSTLRRLLPQAPDAERHIRAYLQRISERPAYQRAIHKADPESPRQLL